MVSGFMGLMKMHADEVETDARLIGRLVASQFPEWAELPIQPVPSSGTDNAMYRLGQNMVVRLPRHQATTERLNKECEWLPRLAPRLPLPVPIPLARGTPAHGYPFEWSVYQWLDGEIATIEQIVDPGRAATELARFVAALQRVDTADGPPPGQHNAFRGVPLKTRDAAVRASIASLRDEIDSRAVTAAWDAALDAPTWDRPPVWIHGDLDARNLLVEQGRLSAVIDFGCLGVGDPACDVMVAWKVFSTADRHVFRTVLAVDDATWARGRGWALSQALNALSYYTLETNAALVREAQRWMAEVLADHSPMSG